MAKCDGKCVLLMAIAKAIGGMINYIIDGNNDNDGDKELVVMLRILIMIKNIILVSMSIIGVLQTVSCQVSTGFRIQSHKVFSTK